ncbi:MAG: TcpD family membrane protein [Cumulibacter sp.]
MNITLEGLKTLVLSVLGAAFLILLVVRIFQHWTKSDWGKMVGEMVIAVVVAIFVFFPETALELIKSIADGLTA